MRNIIMLLASFTIFACKKTPEMPSVTSDFTNGFIALNEGLFQQNNASLSFYSYKSKTMRYGIFSAINKRGLGDTANDMISFIFNGKLYYAIAVNVSSQVEIIDAVTFESIAQVGLFDNGIGREPRTLQYNDGLIYSTNFDGTISLISLESLTETKTISVGQNPEASLIFQDKLFVVNTGGLNFPNYDSTISVLDLTNNSTISTFSSGINGSNLLVDDEGEGYLISRGNYSNIKPKLVRVHLNNYSIIDTYDINCITMTYNNHVIYYYDDETDAIFQFNTKDEVVESTPLIDCSNFENVYKIIINETEQLLYLVDANGYVNSSIIRIYDFDGNFQREIISGLNTNTLIFVQ